MKRSYRPAAVLASLAVCVVAQGQTMVDLQTQARNIDFSGAVFHQPVSGRCDAAARVYNWADIFQVRREAGPQLVFVRSHQFLGAR